MATTEDIGQHHQESGTRTTHKLGDGIERAMADADKRITRLVDKLHNAARGSAAYEGAERDAKRVLEWFQAKANDLETELNKLAKDVGEAARDLSPRREHRESETVVEDPEEERPAETAAETRGGPETMGG